jgi:hypothetical protein
MKEFQTLYAGLTGLAVGVSHWKNNFDCTLTILIYVGLKMAV